MVWRRVFCKGAPERTQARKIALVSKMSDGSTSIILNINGEELPIARPRAGNTGIPSIFVVSLPKAGSTLLNRLMTPLSKAAGLTPFSISTTLRQLGILSKGLNDDLSPLFAPEGYAYTGFRGWLSGQDVPEFAQGRTVLLVRDPRDMLVSLYFSDAFSHAPPGNAAGPDAQTGFERKRQAALSMTIDEYVLSRVDHIFQMIAGTTDLFSGGKARIWRYEDVIFAKRAWVGEMLDYLDLDVPERTIDTIVAKNDIVPGSENPDAHIRRVTPGDHRNKLRPETIEMLNDKMSGFMRTFGYR